MSQGKELLPDWLKNRRRPAGLAPDGRYPRKGLVTVQLKDGSVTVITGAELAKLEVTGHEPRVINYERKATVSERENGRWWDK